MQPQVTRIEERRVASTTRITQTIHPDAGSRHAIYLHLLNQQLVYLDCVSIGKAKAGERYSAMHH